MEYHYYTKKFHFLAERIEGATGLRPTSLDVCQNVVCVGFDRPLDAVESQRLSDFLASDGFSLCKVVTADSKEDVTFKWDPCATT